MLDMELKIDLTYNGIEYLIDKKFFEAKHKPLQIPPGICEKSDIINTKENTWELKKVIF